MFNPNYDREGAFHGAKFQVRVKLVKEADKRNADEL